MPIPFNRSEPGTWISAGLHGLLLAAAIVGFSSSKLPDADEGIPVEIMTDNQFSEMTRGERQASKVMPEPKQRADRVADTRQERDPGEAKVDAPAPPKRPAEVKLAEEDTEAASAPPPPARPEPPKPDPKIEAAKAAAAKAAADAAKTAAEAAKAAAAKAAEAKAVEAQKVAERQEAEALEKARVEAAKAKADAKAQADAKAKAEAEAERRKELAEAKAKAEADAKAKQLAKAKADAEAKEELEAKMKALADAEHRKQVAEAQAKAKAEADAKAKALAQAKAKADAEAKARKQAEAADKFSPGDIRSLLASKEASQSSGATGREVQRTASLGTATGSSQRLNPSQRDQLVGLLSEQLHRCWQVPIAAQSADKPPVPTVRVRLNQDGTLAGEPVVTNMAGDQLFRTVADSATRAARRCAPLRIPPQFQPFYADWRDLLVNFDPRAV